VGNEFAAQFPLPATAVQAPMAVEENNNNNNAEPNTTMMLWQWHQLLSKIMMPLKM
jgi:hypothetical protein